MKRGALAACASLLLVGLLSGSAMAGTTPALSGTTLTGNIDQYNWHGFTGFWSGGTYAQTFTAGETGTVWQVWLCLTVTTGGSEPLAVSIENTSGGVPNGTVLGSVSASPPVGQACQSRIFDFSAANPPVVLASGTTYAIVFTSTDDAVYGNDLGNTYGSGTALQLDGSSWDQLGNPTGTADFEFETWMEDSITPTVNWDKSSITAGTTTPLTLNGSIVFTNGRAGSQADAVGSVYLMDVTVPSWFTPSSVSCSDSAAQDLTASCTINSITNTSVGVSIPYVYNGDMVQFHLVGSASPGLSDGTSGTGHGQGCFTHQLSATPLYCADATAQVAVAGSSGPGPGSSPTPPPTITASGSSDNGSSNLWLFMAGALAVLAAATALVRRRRRPAA